MIMVAEPDQDLNDNPLEAYVTLLRSKGASTKDINLRKHFLRHLTSALKDRELSGDSYRLTVDEVLRNFPDDEVSQSMFKTAAREFYNFWIGDVKSLVKLNNANIFRPNRYIFGTGHADRSAGADGFRRWLELPGYPGAGALSVAAVVHQWPVAGGNRCTRTFAEAAAVCIARAQSSPKVYRAAG